MFAALDRPGVLRWVGLAALVAIGVLAYGVAGQALGAFDLREFAGTPAAPAAAGRWLTARFTAPHAGRTQSRHAAHLLRHPALRHPAPRQLPRRDPQLGGAAARPRVHLLRGRPARDHRSGRIRRQLRAADAGDGGGAARLRHRPASSTSCSTSPPCAPHARLAWIFNCVARLGWLNRMTQFKDKAGQGPGDTPRPGCTSIRT